MVIPDFLVDELKTYLSRLYGFYETDRIFPVVRSYYNKEIERGAKKAGVKKIRVHDLRHSHVYRSKGHFEGSVLFFFILSL